MIYNIFENQLPASTVHSFQSHDPMLFTPTICLLAAAGDFCFVQCCCRTKRSQVSLYVSGCKVTQTLTSVLLEGSRRGHQRRRRVVVHISANGNTSTLPAAPSLAGRTRPVSDRTPLNNKREKEPESPPGFYDNVSAEVQKGTTSRTKNLVVDLIFRTLVQ